MLTFEPVPQARARLRQFALYDDHEAGHAAKWLAAVVERRAAPAREVTRELWKFDVAYHPRQMRRLALQDAGEAEVLIVAARDVARPDPVFLDWLAELAPWKVNRPARGLLLALLDERGEQADEPPSLLRAALTAFSSRAEVEFFWRPFADYREDDPLWVEGALAGWLARGEDLTTDAARSPG
jgi:hypothetical protein